MYVAGPGQQAGVFGVFALVVDLCGGRESETNIFFRHLINSGRAANGISLRVSMECLPLIAS